MTNLPVVPTVPEILLPVFEVVVDGFRAFWWLVLPIALFFIVRDLWLYYIRLNYLSKINWVTLSISIPKEIMKTPKAMEQIFAGLSVMQSSANFVEKWLKGKVQEWISFEIVGQNGEMRFFVRTPVGYRNMIEALIFSQYAQAEIREVEDYVLHAPRDIPNRDYELWGTELILDKDDAYPIRTYPEFEESQEEKRIDPMASLAETMGNLKEREAMWVQILLMPAPKDWKEKGEALVAKLIGKRVPPKPMGFITFLVTFIDEFFTGMIRAALNLEPLESSALSPKKEEGPETKVQFLSPGQKDVVEKIEKKLAKVAFRAGIRLIYWGSRDVFSKANIATLLSYFRQYGTLNMNSFKPNKIVTPSIDYWFKARREFLRKVALWKAYRMRMLTRNACVLNAEELATIYHFPTVFVEAPTIYRIESKKAGPPPSLPVLE